MERLQVLRLDNNHIRKIENLEHLVNLTWLGMDLVAGVVAVGRRCPAPAGQATYD